MLNSRMINSRPGALRRRLAVAFVGSAMLLVGFGQASAQADVTTVQGSAFGYQCVVSAFAFTCTPPGPTPTVTLAQDASNSPQTASVLLANAIAGPATIFSSGQIDVSTQGTLGPTGSVTSSTNIANVNRLGNEPFTADPLTSSCTASEAGVTGSTTITGGTLQTDNGDSDSSNSITNHPPVDVALPASPAPNTSINGHVHIGDGTDTFTYVFNEQVVGTNSITVNAAHEYLLGPTANGDLILGQVVCGVNGPAGTTTTQTGTTTTQTGTTTTQTTTNQPPFPGCPVSTANVVRGNAASNTITGTTAADKIFAGTGNDVVDALAGNDCVDLGAGADRGQGGLGDDFLLGGLGKDTVSGSSGNDRLRGDEEDDRLSGNTGDDSIFGGTGLDVIFGGFGNDKLHGEAGNDQISGSRGGDRINGGNGADQLSGDSSRDIIRGDAGNDRILAGSGSDDVRGNPGRDLISGGSGFDRLLGDQGNDRLSGGNQRDTLSGGDGHDRISSSGDGARDRVNCGRGRDTVIADRRDAVSRNCERVIRR